MPTLSTRGTAPPGASRPEPGRPFSIAQLVLVAVVALLLFAIRAQAQQPARTGATIQISLDDALRMAQAQSQTVQIARAGLARANGQAIQTRSQYLPQLNAAAGYSRTLQSQFAGFASSAAPADTAPKPVASQSLCTPFLPSTASAADRAAALAQAATCPSASGGGGFDLSKTSFGAKNQYQLGLSFSQNVFTGGRLGAQTDAAAAQVRSANIEVAAQRAQVSLDVTSAYYDAVLADQLVAIADSSLAETEAVLAQARVGRQVGNLSEYDLLRAQVTRDNQRPVQIQARSNRQVAYLRLKQLLDIPLNDSVQLTTRLEGSSTPAVAQGISGDASNVAPADRAPVRELDEAIRAQEDQVKIARAERIPSLSIVSQYQRLYFPANGIPSLGNGINNWTVGLSTNFPILDGGRIKGDEAVAQAGLAQLRAQREQARQFADLDTHIALTALQEAQATWEASQGTAEQAQRAYAIDQVRFREGISTQTDLSQSRLLLEQALANRAQAARNFAVARTRLALLRDLPIQSAGGSAATGAAQQQQQQQQQQSSQSRQTTSSPAAAGGATGTPGAGTGGQP